MAEVTKDALDVLSLLDHQLVKYYLSTPNILAMK